MRITCKADLDHGLQALIAQDQRLLPVLEYAGVVSLRLQEPSFAGLAKTIVAQMISVKAAQAIWLRVAALAVPFTPLAFLSVSDEDLRAAGLSRSKITTLQGLAHAMAHEGLDLVALADEEADVALRALTRLKGIGRWTGEIFLMFYAGHPDIFPAGDVALQNAVGHAFGMDERPGEKTLRALSDDWRPHRAVAARLFWSYYRVLKDIGAADPV